MNKLFLKLRIYASELRSNSPITIIKKLISKFLMEIEYFYYANGNGNIQSKSTINISNPDLVIQFVEKNLFLTKEEFDRYKSVLKKGNKTPFGLIQDNELASIAWLEKSDQEIIPPQLKEKEVYSIVDCYTAKAFRGQGLYPTILKHIIESTAKESSLIIFTHYWNIPSQKGIMKAGFKPIAKRIKWRFFKKKIWKSI